MQGSTVTLDPDELVESSVPTGEGMSKQEARIALVEEMNKIIYEKNNMRLAKFRIKLAEYGQHGQPPRPAIIIPQFKGVKNINEVVCMARTKGEDYKSLLLAAGF